ncbi:MAG: hypothetical protein IJU16_01780 [Clostridia bacterium]|nr:hypothetical protein [Clostridia bacterium]
MKRVLGILVSAIMLLSMLTAISGGAFAATETNLLEKELTKKGDGATYGIQDGALEITTAGVASAGAGTTIVVNQKFDLNTQKYLQLEVESTADFNIAFKATKPSGGDMWPQLLTAPWKDMFQTSTANKSGSEQIKAGAYTVVLDIQGFLDANPSLEQAEDKSFQLAEVHIALKDDGKMTIKRLTISDEGTYSGGGGTVTAAPTEAPATTVAAAPATTTTTTAAATSAKTGEDTTLLLMMAAAMLAAGATVVVTLKLKKVK